jgi:hypothetical protein
VEKEAEEDEEEEEPVHLCHHCGRKLGFVLKSRCYYHH